MRTSGMAIAGALAILFLAAPAARAGTDVEAILEATSPLLPEASGKSSLEELKGGSLFELEAKGLALPGAYFACLMKPGTNMEDHLHFPLSVNGDGEAEVRTRISEPPTAFAGGHACVGLHEADEHAMVLMGAFL